MDDAQKMTDSRMRIIRQRLAAEYKQAGRELKKQANEYYAGFKAADLKKRELVKQGKLSQADYIKWRENKMLYGETLKQKVDVMSQHLLNVDKQAAGIINREMFGVYANNYNFAKYQVEKGLHIDTSFTLFDRKTVERMAEKNPKLLRERKTKDGKVLKWSRRKVNTAITQGVLQGESIDKIAKRLVDVVGMQERYAMTNARTAMTAAQNAGRMESFLNSAAMGIKLKKQWMATLDERTRSSHQELDGEIVDINKPFSNELMYPGDPDGAPAEIYNCRCTMIGDLEDYPRENFQRYDNIEGKPIDYVTYKEWLAAKQKTANMAKLDDAQKEVDAIKDAIKAKGADPDKAFSGIWKDDVTYADWEDKKDAIQAKKEYFQKQIQDKQQLVDYGVASSFDQKQLTKFKELLNDLEEFEKNGPEFAPLFKQLKAAEEKVKSIKNADLAWSAFNEARKKAALWAKDTAEYRKLDEYYDKLARKVHATATRTEHKGYYEYTAGSGKFNRPLAGFRGWSWDPRNFVGPGKVDIDEDGRKGIDVALHLDSDSVFVQELRLAARLAEPPQGKARQLLRDFLAFRMEN